MKSAHSLDDLVLSQESDHFSFSDLSTNQSEVRVDLGNYQLSARFVQFNKNGRGVDPIYCTEVVPAAEYSGSSFCEQGVAIGYLIKSKSIELPYWSTRSYYVDLQFQGRDFSKVSYDCLLINAN